MGERLLEAAITGNKELLLVLQQEDAKILDPVMPECIAKHNPLHFGALFGHVEFITEILSQKPEFARELNSQGLTPLHLASERGHVEVVRALLRTDADVCYVRDRDGRIPLHLAAMKGRVEVLEELVKAKSLTAWFLTDEREPILHLCSNHDQFDALKKLAELVKDDKFVTLKDSNDNTILHLLSAKKQRELMNFLLNNTEVGREINALNLNKFTALDVVEQGRWEAGYFQLYSALHRNGAKRANDLSMIHPSIFQWKSTKRDSRWLKEMGPALLVVAVLIVTVTFESVINPPGGIWQDNYPPTGFGNTTNSTLTTTNGVDRRDNHTAGEAILSYTFPRAYYLFSIFNEIGFFASSSIILFIISGSAMQPTISVRILIVSTSIAIISMWLAYTTALSSVSSRRTKGKIYITLTFAVIYAVFLYGPFVGYKIASFRSMVKKMRSGSNQN